MIIGKGGTTSGPYSSDTYNTGLGYQPTSLMTGYQNVMIGLVRIITTGYNNTLIMLHLSPEDTGTRNVLP